MKFLVTMQSIIMKKTEPAKNVNDKIMLMIKWWNAIIMKIYKDDKSTWIILVVKLLRMRVMTGQGKNRVGLRRIE